MEYLAAPASVQIAVSQSLDGVVQEYKLAIRVNGRLPAPEGRDFAARLIAEADRIDRLSGE